MFSKSAKFYDLVYSFKDYASESEKIHDIIIKEHPVARTILDVACGTAEHAKYLVRDFTIEGIDSLPELVEVANRKVPQAKFSVADMRAFDLGKKFDIVQCLFSSIGYLTKSSEVISALKCFAQHLNPGGVVIVEPWFTPDSYTVGMPHMAPPVDLPDVKIARMNVSEKEGNLSNLRFHYLIATSLGIERAEEVHQLALYTVDEMLSFFKAAGLKAEHDPVGIFGRGLYTARKE